jgi:hypothetical protein
MISVSLPFTQLDNVNTALGKVLTSLLRGLLDWNRLALNLAIILVSIRLSFRSY